MKKEGKREYGLVTLMSAVIGTVIGSGIFFKSEEILNITDGNVLLGLLVFAAGGIIMLLCAASFALLSGESGSRGGVVGYAEKMCGKGFARFAALFSADFYLPSMTATLAYVSGGYLCELLGFGGSETLRVAFSGMLLVLFFAANTLTPDAAGKFQVVTVAIKLLPLLVVGAVGCVSLFEGGGVIHEPSGASASFLPALLSSAFAYEGWIAVTALDGNVKNAKRNMPIALVLGSLTVLAVYVLYYLGVVGVSDNGSSTAAFEMLFGVGGRRVMTAFITVSCLGALNGLTMSVVRGHYVLSEYMTARERGERLFGEISARTGIPVLSGIMGLLVSEMWLFYKSVSTWVGFDPAEASISVMYGIYIPIFIIMTVRMKGMSPIKRYVLPLAAALAACVVALAAPVAFGWGMAVFGLLVAAISGAVLFIYRR